MSDVIKKIKVENKIYDLAPENYATKTELNKVVSDVVALENKPLPIASTSARGGGNCWKWLNS